MKITLTGKIAAVVLLAFASSACAPVKEYHGYFPKPALLAKIKEDSHSQREIEMMMGSPSATASFDTNVWYYINSQQHTYAWKQPVVVARQVVAIHFDDETKRVKGVNHYSIKDGRVIAFADDATPTRGRELSFLEQLLGNVGRVATDQFEDKTDR